MLTEREALEAALRADPENLALHGVYADLLTEQGDSRGEFIRLSLRPEAFGEAVDYSAAHEREWLGPLGWLLGPDAVAPDMRLYGWHRADPLLRIGWRRGWADSVTLYGTDDANLDALIGNPVFGLLRSFHADYGTEVSVGGCSRLAEFLARTPVRSLQLLRFSTAGDAVVTALSEAGVVRRLEDLTLVQCALTDDSANRIAREPVWLSLASLNLNHNLFSPYGVSVLRAAGIDPGPQMGLLGPRRDA